MQVMCKTTSHAADVCCSVCGQGFALYWERHNKMERAQALSEIAKTLRSHHRDKSGESFYPRGVTIGKEEIRGGSKPWESPEVTSFRGKTGRKHTRAR